MPELQPEQRKEVSSYLDQALSLPETERGAWLASLREKNPSLAHLLQTLLDERNSLPKEPSPENGPSNPPPTISTGRGLEPINANRGAGDMGDDLAGQAKTIGPYRLIQLLGVGGMGQVWLAEQTEPVRRRVALKLIRAGRYDTTLVKRFQSERQSLAIMEHPAIAKVFDAGATAEGQPYFAMEYVDGRPITDYCDRKKLGIRERLSLFIEVCEGVQHAHQKAIIHRDLKPSNILVADIDGKPVPRIIDFGLAKATAPHTPGETLYTHVGGFLGTPGYMSPEQADPQVYDVDTRTDVYSLGVVLYELLTGSLPFDTSQWTKQPLDQVLRLLRESDPERPSSKVSTNRPTSKSSAEARGMAGGDLPGLLRGDLDWITLKALGRERERRYGTPSALAADVERYLQNRPVEARPASAAYRLRKYVRRHRLAVAVASGAAALLIAFAVMQAIQLRRITRERDRADRITEFMTNMYQVSDPSEARGNTITAREILDKSSNAIESGLGQDVEVQSQLMQVMALTYANLGLNARAHELAERALENRRRTLGPKNRKTLESMTQLGWILHRQGRNAEAEKLIREAIDLQTSQFGREDPLALQTEDNLAMVLEAQGHFSDEEKLERELLPINTRKLGPEHPQTLRSRLNLADALTGESRYVEAEKEFRQLLEIERRIWGTTHPSTLAAMHNLANVLHDQGRYVEAETLHRQTLEIAQRVMGPDHPQTALAMMTLANTLMNEHGRVADAEALYRKALEIDLRRLGPEHSETTMTEDGLANVLSTQHHYAEAEKIHRDILAVRMRLLGPDHTDTLLTQYNISEVMFRQNQYAEAETLIRKTQASQTRVLGPEDPDAMASKTLLARILIKEGRFREAEDSARQAFEAQLRVLGPQHNDTIRSLQYLGIALALNHHYDEAKALFDGIIQKIGANKGRESSVPWYELACVDAAARHRAEAFDHLRRAIKTGESDAGDLKSDDDLKSLRSDHRFNALVAEAQRHPDAAAAPTPTTPGPK
jgi:serine/threonine protein kinase